MKELLSAISLRLITENAINTRQEKEAKELMLVIVNAAVDCKYSARLDYHITEGSKQLLLDKGYKTWTGKKAGKDYTIIHW